MIKLKNNAYTRLSLATALVIGDGCLKKDKEQDLIVRHSMKQLDYIKYKRDLIEQLFNKKITVYEHPESNYAEFHFRHPIFKRLKKKLYPNGKKSIDLGILNQLRHPLAWAIIYCDDGSLIKFKEVNPSTNVTYIRQRVLKIATHNFTYDENMCISRWLQATLGIMLKVVKDRQYFHLRCGSQEAKKFISYIEQYIPKCMHYKADFEYARANPSNQEVKIQSELTGNSESTAEMPVPALQP